VVINALADPDPGFPIFFFPDFIFFRHRPDLQLKLHPLNWLALLASCQAAVDTTRPEYIVSP
jgi:hypothetical protein